MKKILVSILVALLILLTIVLADQGTQNKPNYSLMKRVIAATSLEKDIELLKTKGCLIKHRLKNITSLDCPDNVISTLNVRESRIFYLLDMNASRRIEADKVWAEGITGNEVKVAILDTGIDTDHLELNDSYLGGYDYVNNDIYPEDDHGHGTHVTGIITSNGNNLNSKGVAPNTGIYMYKVCDSKGSCYEDDMMAALEAAVQVGAKVISISIGKGSFTSENCDSDPLAAKVNWAVSQGSSVVIAAGNDGKGVSSPGCASGAIAVGAVDKNNSVSYWSGRGPALDIVAPGADIYSTIIGDYGKMSGTSMATPHVAGVIALLLEVNPSLKVSEIKNALYSTTTSVNKCYGCNFVWGSWCIGYKEIPCKPEITGAGIVNAYKAYLSVKTTKLDSDGDGVPDISDVCPTAYGKYCNGCPQPSCAGCQTSICPTTDQPYCVDDNSKCTAQNATGECTLGECSFECYSNYKNCNVDWSDGCEVNTLFDNNNCGDCGIACEEVACPQSGCGLGGCNEEEHTTYLPTQQASCLNGVCSGECSAVCQYNATCDSDWDNDGVPNDLDACSNIYGKDCNGCPNPCSGCAVMNCPINGAPTCELGTCPSTVCPMNGCGTGTCASNEYGTYTTTSNECILNDNIGICTNNPCILSCVYDSYCEKPSVKCWSSSYQYLYRNDYQMKKFCKCTSGSYNYNNYNYNFASKTVYYYLDSNNNENWVASSRATTLPVYQVTCIDGKAYSTNQDYFR